jgi:pheromone a factor receptor
MVASNHALTAFSFIAFVVVLIPLPWHLEGWFSFDKRITMELNGMKKAWNTGTCLYMIWTAIGNFNFFVNSIAWDGNAYNKYAVWCDICKHDCRLYASLSHFCYPAQRPALSS